jgi:hypothetical protein
MYYRLLMMNNRPENRSGWTTIIKKNQNSVIVLLWFPYRNFSRIINRKN